MKFSEINIDTLLIVPYGRRKSKIYEAGGERIVERVTLSIIKDSCLFFGTTYDGRRDAARNILNVDMKVPILVEDSRDLIFFPVSNCVNRNSIWISYNNLINYVEKDEFSTVLYFRNNRKIVINVKYSIVDNQIIKCLKFESFLRKRKEFVDNIKYVI